MWIDKKRQAETEKRKGLSARTGIVIGILGLGFIISYLLIGWLFSSGNMSIDLFYNDLGVPRSLNQNIIQVILVLVIVFALQFLTVLAFALANPESRKRSGQPTTIAQNPDFFDGQYK